MSGAISVEDSMLRDLLDAPDAYLQLRSEILEPRCDFVLAAFYLLLLRFSCVFFNLIYFKTLHLNVYN